MNTLHSIQGELEKALANKLRELLRSVSWLGDWKAERNPATFDRAFDFLLSGKAPHGPVLELWVDCCAEPRPTLFPYAALDREFENQHLKRVRVRVFAAPFISQRMAEVCERHGWSWFDLAGNCRLSVPDVLHIERRGNEPVHEHPRPSANLGTSEASRVIRALLAPERSGDRWTQRSLQSECQVSLGLMNRVVSCLRDGAFIEEGADGGFRLRDPLGLLAAWRKAYRFDRHHRLGYFTLLHGIRLQAALAELGEVADGRVAYAAFSAADFQAQNVRQPKTWLFLDTRHEDDLKKLVEAKPVDSGENMVILIPDDDGVFYMAEGEGDRLPCTNAVQTYVDLFHCGGRGEEAAEALLEQKLKPAWKRRGLLVKITESMSPAQWHAIREFIDEKLKAEDPYRTTSLALQRHFELPENFYDRMVQISKYDENRRFSVKSFYRRPDEPSHIFDIEFRRR